MFQINDGLQSRSYFFGCGNRFVFEKGKVTVCTFQHNGTTAEKVCNVKLPIFPREMPPDAVLNDDKQVTWLLQHGYIPQIVDDHTVRLVQECSLEQDLRIQAFTKKCDGCVRVLARFRRCMRDNNFDDIKGEEYQGWDLLWKQHGEKRFTKEAELVYDLIEECKQSLRLKQLYIAEECLQALLLLTKCSYIFDDLYADLLSLSGSKDAAKRYLTVSDNKSGEQSMNYLEKAVRSDPADPDVVNAVERLACSDDFAFHMNVIGYKACKDKTSDVAKKYFTRASLLNKKELNTIFPRIANSVTSSPVTTPTLGRNRANGSSIKAGNGTVRTFSEAGLKANYEKNPEALLWWYDGEKVWSKSEYIARTLLEKENKFSVAQALARAVEMQGRIDEAQRLYFAMAESQYRLGNRVSALECLEKIRALGATYGAFSLQEKEIIYLLLVELKCQDFEAISKLKESLKNSRSPRTVSQPALTKIKTQEHFGDRAWFAIDHPRYVACVCSTQGIVLLTSHSAEFQGKEIRLKMDLEFPDDVALFGSKRVRWALSEGYMPIIDGEEVIFVDAKVRRALQVANLTTTHELLQKCKDRFAQELPALAAFYAYEAYRNNPKSGEIQKFYAEFLLLTNRPQEALTIFTKLHHFNKAIVCACLCKDASAHDLYTKQLRQLQKQENSAEKIQRLMLNAYLYSVCNMPQDEETWRMYFNKAEGDCKSFLAPAAALSLATTSAERKVFYKKLAAIFEESEDVEAYKYYSAKMALEESTSSEAIEKALDPFQIKPTTLFVVDMLQEMNCLKPIHGLLAKLEPSSSVHKRNVVLHMSNKNTFGLSSALKALKACYREKPSKYSAVVSLLDRSGLRTEDERMADYLEEDRVDEVAQYYFKMAFRLYLDDKIGESINSLVALEALGLNQENFNSEEKLVIKLLYNLTGMTHLDQKLAAMQLF